jgi:hypothetical protein
MFIDILDVLWRHALLSLILLVTIILAAVAFARTRRKIRNRRHAWSISVAIVLVAFAINAWWADLPIMQIRDLLSSPPLCENAAERFPREHDTWERLLCSRAVESPSLATQLREHHVDCAAALQPMSYAWKGVGGQSRFLLTHSWFTLEQQFTTNLFTTAFLSYLALVLYTSAAAAQLRAASGATLRGILLVVTMINILAIPYVYGKVIHSTRFPKGRVIYKTIDARAQPPSAEKSTPHNALALIISADAKFATIYDTDWKKFVQLDRSDVLLIVIDDSEDLVAARAIDFLQTTPCN